MPLKLYARVRDQFNHSYFALSWSYVSGAWQPQVIEYNRQINFPDSQNPATTDMTQLGIVFPNIAALLVNMPAANNNLLPQIFNIDASGLPHVIDGTNLPELPRPFSQAGIWVKGGAYWIVGMLGINGVVGTVSHAVYKSTDFNPTTGVGTWVEQDSAHRPTLPLYCYWDGSANLISLLVIDSGTGAFFLQEFNTTTGLYTARHDQIPGGLITSNVGVAMIRPTADGGTFFVYSQPSGSPGTLAVQVRAIKLLTGVWGTDTLISTNITGIVAQGALLNTVVTDPNSAAHIWYGFQQSGGTGNNAWAQSYRRMNADSTLTAVTDLGGMNAQTPYGSFFGVLDSGFIINSSNNQPNPSGDTLIVGYLNANDGLTNSLQPGVIRGTPISAPVFTLQQATWVPPDNNSVIDSVFLTNTPSPSLLCPTATTGTVGVPYSSPMIASGGTPPYTYALLSGMLPPGLHLNTSTGLISGTPTLTGLYTFVVQVTDFIGQTANSPGCPITIAPTPPPPIPTLLCPIVTTGTVGVPFSATMRASGGTPPYTFALTGGILPPGLTLNTSTGVISGTPTTAGTYSYTVTVTDSLSQTATVTCSILISAAPPPPCPPIDNINIDNP